jgi:hypothetical protein
MTESTGLSALGFYHVRHAGPTAARAAADIIDLLAAGVTLVDISAHDKYADVVTLRAETESRRRTDDR